VVGQEYGHPPAHVTLEDRNAMIMGSAHNRRFKAEPLFRARNPHMRGTTSLLRLLFSIPLGTDYEGEHIKVVGTRRVHLFDAFAMVNFLLCSALPPTGGTHGMSTKTMHSNCHHHFREVLRILEPTVVVVQGKGFWKSVQRSFDAIEPVSEPNLPVVVGRLSGRHIPTAVFTHPSAQGVHNWGRNAQTPYLLNTVAPTIERIRQRLFSTVSR
jgi:hypothetical protein